LRFWGVSKIRAGASDGFSLDAPADELATAGYSETAPLPEGSGAENAGI
jgi:hypothetical protein